jgi:septal ring factor EnvC (AmiA/AmiB activator)
MKRVFCISLFFLLTLTPLGAQTNDQRAERKSRLQQEITLIDNQLKSNREAQKATIGKITLMQKKISSRKSLLSEMDGQIADYGRRIESKEDEIADLQAERDTLQKYYDRLVYNAYRNRDPRIWFMYVVGSDNISQGFRRFSYLKGLSDNMRAQAAAVSGQQVRLDSEKVALQNLQAAAQGVRRQRQGEYDSMVKDEAQTQKMARQLKGDEQKYKSQIAAKQKEIKRLDDEIARVVRSVIKKDKQDKKNDVALSGKFGQNKGKLPWPVSGGTVIEKFGQHNSPIYKNVKMPFNNGVNILAAKGAPVLCVFDGTVKQILVMPGYNQCVLVQHGSYFTFYCRLSKVNVKNGQNLKAGEQIGVLDTNDEGSPVLHFQIWNGTEKQNPEDWLR